MKPSRAIASFDSASAMLRVLARHLHGTSSPALGLGPVTHAVARALLPAVNRLPARTRELVYTWSGSREAIAERRLGDVDTEAIAHWVADHYPRRHYPAVLIGSSSGAVVHLAALAGVPWLPQTLLVPVRQHGVDPDDPRSAVRSLRAARELFTAANPRIGLHHMHDANQDRLMIGRMAYFRFKYRRLPAGYAAFLADRLPPGGTVLVVDCGQTWPTSGLGPRQVFQHGAVGGASAEEYERGGPRVAAFLAEQGSPRLRWDAPEPDSVSPEAEWGFDQALLPDLARLCDRHGWELARLSFSHPDSLSGPVAEMHRAWYSEHDVDPDRLLVDCFALMDVHLPLRLALVPYWVTFGTRPARDAVLDYLSGHRPFHEVHIGLFSHGTCSIGWAGIGDWDEVIRGAGGRGGYCGVDRAVYPQDFASNVRFHDQLAALTPQSRAAPHPAPWAWIREHLRPHLATG